LLEGSMIILAKPDSVYVNKNYKRKESYYEEH